MAQRRVRAAPRTGGDFASLTRASAVAFFRPEYFFHGASCRLIGGALRCCCRTRGGGGGPYGCARARGSRAVARGFKRMRGPARAAPGAPASVIVASVAGDALAVAFSPPVSDGGSAVTSYRVEWDTNPGTREVQAVTTSPTYGANEIQTLRTVAPRVNEVKSVYTRATTVYEQQTITTSAYAHETLGGSFTLSFTASDGGTYVSGPIAYNAAASTGSHRARARARAAAAAPAR